MTTTSCHHQYCCRSSFRSVPANKVNDFQFSGCRSGPHSKSKTVVLHSEIEHLEEKDFSTFRNETVKLLSEIRYNAKERKRQVTASQQVMTFQLPEVTQATAGCEYIPSILDTQPVSVPVVQPSQPQHSLLQ